ncbi:hypothetical protein ACN2XU_10925 [Primorskyibacter sp. 2E107]|uniref:hypothetical protein n=1 Tax=Primorskyibacter sp. 2E107 TaxID=3403458 RepID=UPI003AF7A9E4
MLISLAIPAALLMLTAVLVSRALERLTPETVFGLALNAIISFFILWALATVLFMLIYHWRGAPLDAVFGEAGGVRHMTGVGLQSALLWVPMVGITVATAPRRWRHNIW